MTLEKPTGIPLSLAPISLPAQLTVGSIRHLLTTIGGYWIALGLTNADISTLLWGAGLTGVGVLWSYVEKIAGQFVSNPATEGELE